MPPDADTERRASRKRPQRGGRSRRTALANYLRRAYVRFVKIRGTPRQIAGGVAIGLFIGFSPIVFQTVLAVFLAALSKANKFAAAAGVWITNPFTAPFIFSVTYMIGAPLIGLHNTFSLRAFADVSAFIELVQQAPRIFIALQIGGIIVGIPTAAIGYLITYRAVETYQTDLKARIARRKERLKQNIKRKRKNKSVKAEKKRRS